MARLGRVLLLLLAGASAIAQPVFAQRNGPWRVAGLAAPTEEGRAEAAAFQEGMRELGYVEGRNIVYLDRPVDPDPVRQDALIDELIALKPDVLVGWESVARAMRARTVTIPIVLTGGIDPVAAGLARSVRRPGLNVTGVAQLNEVLPQKHIELLAELLPQAQHFAMLRDRTASGCVRVEQNARVAAKRMGKQFVVYDVGNGADIERAFARMERRRPGALLPCPSPMLFNQRALLLSESLRLRIPWSSFIVATVPTGVLFAYSSSRHEEMRRAAIYVDRILKGAKPGELPIEQPTRFELVVNLATARALGIDVPPSVLRRADRVIE